MIHLIGIMMNKDKSTLTPDAQHQIFQTHIEKLAYMVLAMADTETLSRIFTNISKSLSDGTDS